MPLTNYGVLKGQVSRIETEPEDTRSPHVHLTLDAGNQTWVASLNVKSRAGLTEQDKWLLFHVSANFRHPVTDDLPALAPGFHHLPSNPLQSGLDYIRQNLVAREKMRALPPEAAPGDEGDDLNEALVFYLSQAQRRGADCYVFGDAVTDWRTGKLSGLHDIHLNQGSEIGSPYAATNGTYQDGGLLIHHRLTRRTLTPQTSSSASRWVALFLAFQAQAWHTDDRTGHPLLAPAAPAPPVSDGAVRIVAARLDFRGRIPSSSVTLLNASTDRIVLDGWKVRNGFGEETPVSGVLYPGEAQLLPLIPYHTYFESGGYFSLLDNAGQKIHGVSYTSAKVQDGGVIVF